VSNSEGLSGLLVVHIIIVSGIGPAVPVASFKVSNKDGEPGARLVLVLVLRGCHRSGGGRSGESTWRFQREQRGPMLALVMHGITPAVQKYCLPSELLQALPDHASSAAGLLGGQASFPSPIQPPKPQGGGQASFDVVDPNLFLPPPKPRGVACPKCDEIYAEIWELKMRWLDFSGESNSVLYVMQTDMYRMCAQQTGYPDLCEPRYVGCYVVSGNSTRYSPEGQAVTCDRMPFRHFAHVITSYAINGSDMHIEITGNASRARLKLEISVPNSWLVQTALLLHQAINALPANAWHALKLGDNASEPAAPPYPSSSEVFATLLTNKTSEYIQETAASWPYSPPPPPPPPTPPPCPGGSLQECMNLCPKTPIEAYKACVKACLDVCHTA